MVFWGINSLAKKWLSWNILCIQESRMHSYSIVVYSSGDIFAREMHITNKTLKLNLGWIAHHSSCCVSLQWRHNGHDSVTIVYSTVYSDARSKKTSKLRVTGLCVPAQMASYAENVSILWRHHVILPFGRRVPNLKHLTEYITAPFI